MGRRAMHTVDDFLDAAVALFAAGGTRAVTMSAVARQVGAPSGSIYHRFKDRPALLAEVWLRTVQRFQTGMADIFNDSTSADRAVKASAWFMNWCRAHPTEAAVLYAGPQGLLMDAWDPADRKRLTVNERERNRWMSRTIKAIGAETGRHPDEVLLVLVDLPKAVSSRYLSRGERPPKTAVDLVERVATIILNADLRDGANAELPG